MLTLRLTQTTVGQDRYRVEVALEGEGRARRAPVVLSYNSYASHPRIDCRGDRLEVIKAGAWGCPPYRPD
jgi:hypothetical protein